MSNSERGWAARAFARGPGLLRPFMGLPAAALALMASCGGERSAISTGADLPVEQVLSVRELLGRFPPDPNDQTADGIIERALALAVGDGFIYVLDGSAGEVLRLDLEARFLGRVGSRGDGPGELAGPIGLSIGRDGDVWLADPSAGRLARFSATGEHVEDRRTAYPPVNFTVSASGEVLVPSLDAATMLARVTPDGATELAVDPEIVPDEVSTGAGDRLSLRGLMLAGLSDGRVAMLQNRHGTNFRMWMVDVDEPASAISEITELILPRWLYTILAEETEMVRSTVPEEFAQGDFLIPFKGLHADGERVWLAPTPSSRVIALSVPANADQRWSVVVGAEDVYYGLIGAAVMGDRLITLYDTEVRVYRLDDRGARFEY